MGLKEKLGLSECVSILTYDLEKELLKPISKKTFNMLLIANRAIKDLNKFIYGPEDSFPVVESTHSNRRRVTSTGQAIRDPIYFGNNGNIL